MRQSGTDIPAVVLRTPSSARIALTHLGIRVIAEALTADGLLFDADAKEFSLGDVPVHLVTPDLVTTPPRHLVELDGIRTVSLADLINLKLRSGLSSMLRAQDLADVIGLIRHHKLGGEFATKLDKLLRSEFRKLANAVARGIGCENPRPIDPRVS